MVNGNGTRWFLGPLGSLVTICATMIGGVAVLLSQIYSIRIDMKDALHLFDTRLVAVEAKMLRLPAADRWRWQDQIIWSADLQQRNLELDVPDPRAVIRDRTQDTWSWE